MSALAEFLKGKVDESLTKLAQPAGLVPATAFVLLNLAFVYPALKTYRVGFAMAFSDLDGTWQVVAVASVILLLGYLLLSISSDVLDLLAGESWRGSWLYRTLKNRVQSRLQEKALLAAYPDPGALEALGEVWELRAGYPITNLEPATDATLAANQLGEVAPTALGNVIRASHRLIVERYGIDPVALWSQMEAIADKDSAA